MMYEYGQGVSQDYHLAFNWYQKAAEQNDSDAQNKLGRLYEKGQGVARNEEKSKYWFQKAAKHEDEDAGSEFDWDDDLPF